MTDAPAMLCWAVDVETTGQKEPVEVIEFARAEVFARPGPTFELGEPTIERFRPSKQIELGALATHHILPEELADCPPVPERFELPRYVLGHNVDYDWAALGSQESVKRIDTLALAREAWPILDSYKLGALVYHLFPAAEARALLKDAHSAGADIRLCFQVFAAAMLTIPTEKPIGSWGAVWRLSEAARVPKIMPISKEHKGKPIAEVPADFAQWYARQKDTDPYLIQAFRNAGLIPTENAA